MTRTLTHIHILTLYLSFSRYVLYVQNLRVILVLLARKVAKIDRTRSCWRSGKFINPTYACLTYMYPLRFFVVQKYVDYFFSVPFSPVCLPVLLFRTARLSLSLSPRISRLRIYVAFQTKGGGGECTVEWMHPLSNCAETNRFRLSRMHRRLETCDTDVRNV